MPRFRYALQPAVDHSLAHERGARAAVQRAEDAVNAQRRALSALEAQLRSVRLAIVASIPQCAAGRLYVEAHAAALAGLRAAARGRESVAAMELASARAAHDDARRRNAALCRHRERRYAEFVAARERRDADELAEVNALRRKASASLAGNTDA